MGLNGGKFGKKLKRHAVVTNEKFNGEKTMFDVTSTLMWVTLGVGVFALAFVEYRFSAKKRTSN